MPTIDISFEDLQKLVGKRLPREKEELGRLLESAKAEIESFEGDNLSIELGDSNRPELWCPEGLAREIKGALGAERGLKEYSGNPSDLKVFVNAKLQKIRPYIACAVVKGVQLSDAAIKHLMQLQDKIDSTYGRNRKKTSIGMYNFDLLKFPLKYALTKPHENPFVPLGFSEKLAPHEILRAHPKGLEYGLLLKGLPKYPIFLDSDGKVLSMPPVINSADLGKIGEQTKNILVEVTGTDYNAVNHVLTIVATALVERGGQITNVTIDYPYRKPDTTPHLETEDWKISTEQANSLLGVKLGDEDVIKLLQKARYFASADNGIISVRAPCYRKDIMHPVDIIEDIAIAYGYNNFAPESVALPTAGRLSSIQRISNKIREVCVGLGGQEVLNFTLTNKENLFKKMGTKEENVIELENPISLNYSVLRNKIIPSLLEFLSRNTKREFPQRVFEVGDVVHKDSKAPEASKTERRLAFAVSHSSASFTEAKQLLEAIFRNLGSPVELREAEHDSFIAGRCAKIFAGNEDAGIIGEIHPAVLENWGIEMPVVAFEVIIEKTKV